MIKMDPDLSLTQKVCHLWHFIKDFFCLWITLLTITKSAYFFVTEIEKILHVCGTSTFLYFGILLDFKISVFSGSMPSCGQLCFHISMCLGLFHLNSGGFFWFFFFCLLLCYFTCFSCICLVLERLGESLY